ncbi:hypothetical protein ACJQWK_05179 [Exserohilum turcicum]
MPGPAVWKGGAGGGSTSAQPAKEEAAAPAPTTLSTVVVPTPAAGAGTGAGQAGCAAPWAQCGGQGFSGAKCCTSGTCKVVNAYYSQCQ